ncbi:hypothetical protein Sar04_04330 [Salinispora arenicola]|uniref:Uncharacterized protein n=1 Tax=Salinispora arenicola TaxID=168697 RepID=A0ABQ4JL23_SALAC|nr:hypothetical protein Sar04_04330 [Salinispora arenicola]
MTAIAGELHVRVTEVSSESARTVVTLVGAGAYAFDPRSRRRAGGPVGWDGGVANGGERNARAGPAGRAGGIGAVGIESPVSFRPVSICSVLIRPVSAWSVLVRFVPVSSFPG